MLSKPARSAATTAIGNLRREWSEATDGRGLLETKAPVGLVLFDFGRNLGLTPDEMRRALGNQLYDELQERLG